MDGPTAHGSPAVDHHPWSGGWEALTSSVRGPTHERDGTPNQDAIAWAPIDSSTASVVLALADGHGSRRYVRSHIGARLAVEVAIALAARIAEVAAEHGPGTQLVGRLEGEVAQVLVSAWQGAVARHLSEEPVTEAEVERGGVDMGSVTADPIVIYGSTLLVCVLTGSIGAFLQIGDGDIVLVRSDGRVRMPIPGDDRLIGNETTSLCLPEADQMFRAGSIDLRDGAVAMVLAATDGYGNSFASGEDRSWEEAVGADLLAHLRSRGPAWVEGQLARWLEESATHSGDDTTLGVLFRADEITGRTHDGSEDGEREVEGVDDDDLRDDHGSASPPGQRRFRVGTVVLAVLLALLTGVGIGLAAERVGWPWASTASADELDYGGRLWSLDPGSVTAVDPGTGEPIGTVALGPVGEFIGSGGGAVWISSSHGGTAYRVDARTLGCVSISRWAPVARPCDADTAADEETDIGEEGAP